MSQKSVRVKLDPQSQASLKKSGYSMCFAKKVNDTYNVVWQSIEGYLANTTFSWTPEYEVFGTNTYEETIKVEADTNTVKASLGEKCKLNKQGIMESAVTGDKPMDVVIVNEYGPIHSGISQTCKIGDVESCSPIYVSEQQRMIGDIQLTPKEKVMVWFQANVETGTIFEEARSKAIEINLTNDDKGTVSYDAKTGIWTTVAG